MTADYIAPLRLDYIFQNVLAGTPQIFFALFIIAFSVLAGIFKMSGSVYLILLALASILLYSGIGGTGLFVIVIFIGGLLIFWAIQKLVKN
jgi:hypothetical protein